MKYIYLFIGFLSLILGVIGIFLPVLPTTPFSPRAYDWLLAHKYLGPYIRSFREDRMIPLRAKIVSISLLWLTALHCAILLFEPWWLRIGMVVMAACVTAYILSFKTRPSAK